MHTTYRVVMTCFARDSCCEIINDSFYYVYTDYIYTLDRVAINEFAIPLLQIGLGTPSTISVNRNTRSVLLRLCGVCRIRSIRVSYTRAVNRYDKRISHSVVLTRA